MINDIITDPVVTNVKILNRIATNGIVLSRSPSDYPKWFEYNFGITDPYSRIIELVNEGYACLAPIDFCISKLKLSDLKEELQKQGLSDKGKKEELINRLCACENLSEGFVPEVAIITEKGRNYLSEQEENMFADSLGRFGVSVQDYFTSKKQLGAAASRDEIVVNVLEYKQFAEGLEYWTYYEIQSEMARLYDKLGDKKKAMLHYIGNAYFHCCSTAKLLNSPKVLDPEKINPIYFHKDYFEPAMIEFVERLIVPEDAATARYNIEYFKKQIYDIVYNNTYTISEI